MKVFVVSLLASFVLTCPWLHPAAWIVYCGMGLFIVGYFGILMRSVTGHN